MVTRQLTIKLETAIAYQVNRTFDLIVYIIVILKLTSFNNKHKESI
jgi:hypothetical protein